VATEYILTIKSILYLSRNDYKQTSGTFVWCLLANNGDEVEMKSEQSQKEKYYFIANSLDIGTY
jgi:hypothetical protein